jgi:AAA15 family ATPase/GTPase
MLISFSVSNWLIFRDEVTFSMLATSEKRNKETLTVNKSLGIRILPVAAIYGGNASGKTKFIDALSFVKNFIIKGTSPGDPIKVRPFKLNKEYLQKPSSFKVTILITDKCYEYSFTIDKNTVIEEKLLQQLKTSEKVLYSRDGQNITFFPPYKKNSDKNRLDYISEGTRENQLLLTNLVDQNIQKDFSEFGSIYNWFKNSLTILGPRSSPNSNINNLLNTINNILPSLDTGICDLQSKEVEIKDFLTPFIESAKQQAAENPITLRNLSDGSRIFIDSNGRATKLIANHLDNAGKKVSFEMGEESDGTERLIDLLPLFIHLTSQNHSLVYVVDEIDRSLHTDLLIKLLEFFLNACNTTNKSQLIFTTHNLLTMTEDLLRRDEMWVTERNEEGFASLNSFSDYKEALNDKKLLQSYRQGRLGGIPNIHTIQPFMDDNNEKNEI